MATGLSIAIAKPTPTPAPAPTKQAAVTPKMVKGSIIQELHWTFAYKRPVRVGRLMTKQEKRQYVSAMQAAKTVEARQQIRELTYAKLRLRAQERGMYVVIPATAVPATRSEVATPIPVKVSEVAPKPVKLATVAPVHQSPAPVATVHPPRLPPQR